MAYILTSLFSMKDFSFCEFTVLPRLCVLFSGAWLSSLQGLCYSPSVHKLCDLLSVCIAPCLCVLLFPWWRVTHRDKVPISYDRALCGWSQRGGGVTASKSPRWLTSTGSDNSVVKPCSLPDTQCSNIIIIFTLTCKSKPGRCILISREGVDSIKPNNFESLCLRWIQ